MVMDMSTIDRVTKCTARKFRRNCLLFTVIKKEKSESKAKVENTSKTTATDWKWY